MLGFELVDSVCSDPGHEVPSDITDRSRCPQRGCCAGALGPVDAAADLTRFAFGFGTAPFPADSATCGGCSGSTGTPAGPFGTALRAAGELPL